jgi:hypothetical protein
VEAMGNHEGGGVYRRVSWRGRRGLPLFLYGDGNTSGAVDWALGSNLQLTGLGAGSVSLMMPGLRRHAADACFQS